MECNQSKCLTSSLTASDPSVDCEEATCRGVLTEADHVRRQFRKHFPHINTSYMKDSLIGLVAVGFMSEEQLALPPARYAALKRDAA